MIAENGITIKYGNVAPGAKENFISETDDKEDFVNLGQFQEYNLGFPNFGNPLEKYSVLLDGAALPFPSAPENANLGLWSKQISRDDGTFETPIVLNLKSEGKYSSQSLSFTFDAYNSIFATALNIKWYQEDENDELLAEDDFYPDSAAFSCEKTVENYNKVVITFYSINMPQNRLKLRAIDYGYSTFFYGKDLRAVNVTQQINPISTQIAINTTDFTVDTRGQAEYLFQEKQPIEVYFNGKRRSTTFIKSSKRKSQTQWHISSEDYIGILEDTEFKGDVYDGKNAVELLTEIFNIAKVPFEISEDFNGEVVSGRIPYDNCRKALMQVAVAIGAAIDTSNSNVIKVYKLSNEIKQTIPLSRVMQGQNATEEDKITAVEVSAHTFVKTDEIQKVYDGAQQGAGYEIFLKFSEPLHDLEISNGNIIKSNANYAIINAGANCIMQGKKYQELTFTKSKKNPNVTANTKQKVAKINNATLITPDNLDRILNSCYNYLTKTRVVKAKIVEGKGKRNGEKSRYGEVVYGTTTYGYQPRQDESTAVGETNTIETAYWGNLTGIFVKQSYSLVGGIVIKDTEIRI